MTTIKNSKTHRAPTFLIVAVTLHLLSAPAGADMMYNQEQVPVERLIARLMERLAEKPDDPHAHYTLGRVHYLAAAHGQAMLNIVERRYSSPSAPGPVLEHWSFPEMEDARPLEKSAVHEHTRHAVKHHRRALKMADEPLYHLGLASFLEELAEHAGEVELDDPLTVPFDLAVWLLDYERGRPSWPQRDRSHAVKEWQLVALDHYAKAFEKQFEHDLGHRDWRDLGLITLEAVRGFRNLARKLGAEEVRAEQLKKLAEGRREIELFGSVTWWMFWEDGYQALSMLDDDGSGWLRGSELDGLAVWFDRNGNGIADPGEVTPVRDLEIAAIAVEATGEEAGNADGRARPESQRWHDPPDLGLGGRAWN